MLGSYPAYTPCDSNQGWHGEWFYIRNPVEAPFFPFTNRRPERQEMVMGPRQPVEQEARDYRGEALEAGAVGTRRGVGVPHLLPPSGHPTGGEDVADVDVQWIDGP